MLWLDMTFRRGYECTSAMSWLCIVAGSSRGEKAVFLEKPHQANVKVHAPVVAFPTAASFLQNMEARLDTSESLAMARITYMELQLVQAENNIIKDVLHASIGRLLR